MTIGVVAKWLVVVGAGAGGEDRGLDKREKRNAP